MAQKIQTGDTISVHYTGRIQQGNIFDSSQGREPLKFTVGSGLLIKGFDRAVIGMKPGETKTVTIEPEDGYGLRDENMFLDIPKARFPSDLELKEGLHLEMKDPNGNPLLAVVKDLKKDVVRMDINHYLAGKILEFDITVVETGLEPDPLPCGSGGCTCDSKGCDHGNCHS